MSISDSMLAQALVAYLQEHQERFREFVLAQCNIDADLHIAWREDKTNNRLIATVTTLDSSQQTLSQHDYALKIEPA